MIPSLEISEAQFETMWRQNALGGFLVGREAVRRMLPKAKRHHSLYRRHCVLACAASFLAFASAKAALRAVAQGLRAGVRPARHSRRACGHRRRHRRRVCAEPVPGLRCGQGQRRAAWRLTILPDAYWALHRQPRSAWTHELDLRPFREARSDSDVHALHAHATVASSLSTVSRLGPSSFSTLLP